MCTKFPPTVMIFGVVVVVVRSEGHIITPPFFPQGLRVNADAGANVETFQTTVAKLPRIDSIANGGRPPMSSSKIRIHPIKLSKASIGWPRIVMIISHQTYGRLLTTHQT
ncbi:hypothetical protein ACTXT7_001806 [Hymenolepis weldensis]